MTLESMANFMMFQPPTLTNQREKQFCKKFQWLVLVKDGKQGYKIVKAFTKDMLALDIFSFLG